MQAIQTTYKGPGNVRGSRIIAKCQRGRVSVSYPSELSIDGAHTYAADQLVARFVKDDQAIYGTPPKKNPWNLPRVIGQLPNGDYVHVFVEGSR